MGLLDCIDAMPRCNVKEAKNRGEGDLTVSPDREQT
jgi:hypothetical protein